jgi:hypothetical protein
MHLAALEGRAPMPEMIDRVVAAIKRKEPMTNHRLIFSPGVHYAPRSASDTDLLWIVGCKEDAMQAFYESYTVLVLCVDLPRARLCHSAQDACEFYVGVGG